jgi:glycosyltransferase involved in cell wall biosynthesis
MFIERKNRMTDLKKGSEKIPRLSIIIITLNEENNLENCINSLLDGSQLSSKKIKIPIEIIVSDGGSTDRTLDIAKKFADVVIKSLPGRSRQCNKGARIAKSENLLFLHSDTTLTPSSLLRILHYLNDPCYIGGAFSKKWVWSQNSSVSKFIKVFVFVFQGIGNLVSRTFRTYPADNAIFIRKKFFNELNGFRNMWICEGFDLINRMKKFAKNSYLTKNKHCRNKNGIARIYFSHACTSARRFEESGFTKTIFTWIFIIFFWRLGMPQDKMRTLFNKGI